MTWGLEGDEEKSEPLRSMGYTQESSTLGNPRHGGRRPFSFQVLWPPLSTGDPTPDYLQGSFHLPGYLRHKCWSV